MEQETRNKLQRATQQIRRLLEEEFAEQLEGTFDILASGKILPSAGKHLDARQRLTRQKLVDAIEHIKAGGKNPQEAVEEYTREAAFTFLNRFVALRMLEARGLLQECVSKGDQSSGFKEFCGLAPGLASLPDGGYRLYLECLFDELSVEVKVLFDRRDSASLLWPRRGALTALLNILGQTDLASVWGEDETIGWVYQYFNSVEERKKMREEARVAANSRELAVRNQFFTPRYVVEFLTDNTLGRIWYEMQKGTTRLIDECRYLVRRPCEVFLSEGQEPPVDEDDADLDLSKEELLKKTVYILHRAKKDPRDLKTLDPACGSGHFLLYAFDLLISIYEEAWHDVRSPKSQVTGNTLKSDYPQLLQLHAALPGLVLAHNLHGIDIDPRAAQIAALALWMRGQRALNDFGISRNVRPTIAKSNIVCAEPMPGEAAFLDEFVKEHLSSSAEDRFLGTLVRKVFESMKLAGEAGSLLMIEADIAEEVAKAKKHWLERPGMKQKTLFEERPTTVQKELDLTRGITDESFWEDAELRIYNALRNYSEQAEHRGAFQKRLFAADTSRGFAFVDNCRHRFDVVLMNPPFGECSMNLEKPMRDKHGSLANDIYVLFIVTMLESLSPRGSIGAITSRAFLTGRDQREFRPRILGNGNGQLRLFADLGLDVLDGAAVETAMYTIEKCGITIKSSGECIFYDFRAVKREDLSDFESILRKATPVSHKLSTFLHQRQASILYSASDAELAAMKTADPIDPTIGRVTKGLDTGQHERFLYLFWEVPFGQIGTKWRFCAKGGEYSWFISNINTVLNWHLDGRLIAEYTATVSTNVAQARRSSKYYFLPALTCTYRCTDFSLRALPRGCVFTSGARVLIPNDAEALVPILASFLSEEYDGFLRQIEKKGKYEPGPLGGLPAPRLASGENLHVAWQNLFNCLFFYEQRIETSPYFSGIASLGSVEPSRVEVRKLVEAFAQASGYVSSGNFVEKAVMSICNRYTSKNDAHRIISYCMGRIFGRFGTAVKLPTCDPFTQLDTLMPALRSAISLTGDIAVDHDAREGMSSQLCRRLRTELETLGEGGGGRTASDWISAHFGDSGLSDYLGSASGFFAHHILDYSAAFRKAPIYWQLSTPSASYSVWLYFHTFTRDTFFQVLNEYVKPKRDHERQKLDRLMAEAGAEPIRSLRKEIENQERFVADLSTMIEEVERIAPLWNPNLNDGVIINFAPLWRLVPQNKSWQKECKECWDKLVAGEYDWAYLAMHLWPERVVPKCVDDASLAIAHGLEDIFWKQDDKDRFQPMPIPEGGWQSVIDHLIKGRTSPAVKAALKSLLEAPTAAAPASKSRARRGTAS